MRSVSSASDEEKKELLQAGVLEYLFKAMADHASKAEVQEKEMQKHNWRNGLAVFNVSVLLHWVDQAKVSKGVDCLVHDHQLNTFNLLSNYFKQGFAIYRKLTFIGILT